VKVVCVWPHGMLVPGDETEVPDGAEFSACYAEPGSPEALRAQKDRAVAAIPGALAADGAPSAPEPPAAPPAGDEPPGPAPAVLTAPSAAKAGA
jgi:hypothetical protein